LKVLMTILELLRLISSYIKWEIFS